MSVERNDANTASTCVEDVDFLNFIDMIEIDAPPVTAESPVLSTSLSQEREVGLSDGETPSNVEGKDQDLVGPSDTIYIDAPPGMVVTAKEPPVVTTSLSKERDMDISDGLPPAESQVPTASQQDPCESPSNEEGQEQDLVGTIDTTNIDEPPGTVVTAAEPPVAPPAESQVLTASEQDKSNTPLDEEEKHQDLVGPSDTIYIEAPPEMVVTAEEPPVGTTSLSKERDMGLSDGVLPAESQIPTAFKQDPCETPSNEEEKDNNFLVGLSGTIIEPAENMGSENIGEVEHLASLNGAELHVGAVPAERLSPSIFNKELKSNQMMNSMNTVDSWGGIEGVVPPLPGLAPIRSTEIVDFSNSSDQGDDNSCPARTVLSHDENSSEDTGVSVVKEVAEFVNVDILMNPSSFEYFSPQVNESRRRLQRMKTKKRDEFSLDGSGHTKSSLIEERMRASSYRGPKQTKVKGVLKTGTSFTSIDESINSAPTLGRDEGNRPTTMRRCSFSFVDIREHERIAGDNPCVTRGVPLSIGWGYIQHQPIELDHYERNKGSSRDKIEMLVPAEIRRRMLRDEFGVSFTEMDAAIKEVNITKRNRRYTVANEHMDAWKEVLQSAKRKFRRIVKKTSTTQEEEKLWEQAHKSAMKEYLKIHGPDSLGTSPERAGVGSINKGPNIVSDKK